MGLDMGSFLLKRLILSMIYYFSSYKKGKREKQIPQLQLVKWSEDPQP
jgi:hypothetical protein